MLKNADSSIKVVDAIKAGDVELLRDLMTHHMVSCDDELYTGQTPLGLAITQQKCAVVDFLLSLGASVKKQTRPTPKSPVIHNNHNTQLVYPLQLAVQTNCAEMIEHIFDQCPHLDYCNGGAQKLIYTAVTLKAYSLVRKVVDAAREEDMLIVSSFNLSEALKVAVLQHDTRMVKILTDLGANINREYDGVVPLVLAANTYDLRMCLSLINQGACLNSTNCGMGISQTPLSQAIRAGLENAVLLLLKLGSDPSSVVDWSGVGSKYRSVSAGSSMLHFAVIKQNLSIVKTLIAAGAKLNQADSDGNTPLHLACTVTEEDTEMLQYLLYEEAKLYNKKRYIEAFGINSKNKKGRTPLMVAVQHKNFRLISPLVEVGASLNICDSEKKTPLHHAVENDSEECVVTLIEAGSYVDGLVSKGQRYTPLQLAVKENNETLGKILIEAKANIYLLSTTKENLIHLAVQGRSEEFVKMFLEKSVDVNCRTTSWETPLMLAARQDNLDICRLLIEGGAKLNIRDRNQETALSLSVYFGFEENARLLIINGADLNIPDKRKSTPIYWSIFNCRVKTVMLLILASAKFTLKDLYRYPKNLSVMKNKQLFQWLITQLKALPTLQNVCRKVIRMAVTRHTGGTGIKVLLDQLPLPTRLLQFLVFETEEVFKEFNFFDFGYQSDVSS